MGKDAQTGLDSATRNGDIAELKTSVGFVLHSNSEKLSTKNGKRCSKTKFLFLFVLIALRR